MGGWVEAELVEYYNTEGRVSGLSSSHGIFQARAWGITGRGDGLEGRLTHERRAALRRVKAAALALHHAGQRAQEVLGRAFAADPVPTLVELAFGWQLGRVVQLTPAFRKAGEAWARHELALFRNAKANARRRGIREGAVVDDAGVVTFWNGGPGGESSMVGCPECESPILGFGCERKMCRMVRDHTWAEDAELVMRAVERMAGADPSPILAKARPTAKAEALVMVRKAVDAYADARALTDVAFTEPPRVRFTLDAPREQREPKSRRPPRIKQPPGEPGS